MLNWRKIVKSCISSGIIIQKLPESMPNSVLLTFDDGPHPEITPKVLELLSGYNARAIFFIVGRRMDKAPQVIRKIHDQGHLVGNHTFIHSNGKQPGFLSYLHDVSRCQSAIEYCIGKKPKTFRPPGGRISLKSLMASKIFGMKFVLWSRHADDWKTIIPKRLQKIGEDFAQEVSPRDILLFHDDNDNVLTLLEKILPVLHSRGVDLYGGTDFFK